MAVTTICLVILMFTTSGTGGFLFKRKVCYEDVGCFTNYWPFNNAFLALPDSPKDVDVKTYLWTRQNVESAQEINYHDLSSFKGLSFDASRPTKVLVHGYLSNIDTSPVTANLSRAFLKQGDYNVIGVDWSKGASKLYQKSVANTRLVGVLVANMLKVLKEVFGLQLEDLHVIGHSLGAHIAGYIGTHLPGISRITGLDPAGPMFAKTDARVRLDPSDALFVDVIHTDGAQLEDAGFGTLQRLGDLDFYPNGGQRQPGCSASTSVIDLIKGDFRDAINDVSCAHDRAIWYFIESVTNTKCQFMAYPCPSSGDFENNDCNTCGKLGCPEMGINAIKYRNMHGTFYLSTNVKPPFCKQK